MNDASHEWVRFRAYGNQMIDTHMRLLDLLDDLRHGIAAADDDLAVHCLAFCTAVTRHHTTEDTTVFPLLAERHPQLRDFLAELERDHLIIAGILERLRDRPDARELDGLAAILETHFIGEEKRLAGVLDALEPVAGLDLGLADT
jgi:hypothetical protein